MDKAPVKDSGSYNLPSQTMKDIVSDNNRKMCFLKYMKALTDFLARKHINNMKGVYSATDNYYEFRKLKLAEMKCVLSEIDFLSHKGTNVLEDMLKLDDGYNKLKEAKNLYRRACIELSSRKEINTLKGIFSYHDDLCEHEKLVRAQLKCRLAATEYNKQKKTTIEILETRLTFIRKLELQLTRGPIIV